MLYSALDSTLGSSSIAVLFSEERSADLKANRRKLLVPLISALEEMVGKLAHPVVQASVRSSPDLN